MKKAISIILSIVLVFTGAFALCGAAAETCSCGKAPVIHIAGLGGSFYDGDTLVFPPQAGTVIRAVMKALPATPALLGGSLNSRSQEQVLEVAAQFFDPIAFDKTGEPVNNVRKTFTYPETIDHESGDYVFFDYDWRFDPFEIADQLKDFIEYVKQQTGHSTVYLIGESMGTVEMNAYLSVYGFDGIEGVVWCNGAYNGVASCGDSFANKNNFTKESLMEFFTQLAVSADNSFLFDLFTALDTSGLLQTVFDSVLSGTVDLQESGMFSRFLREYIGRIPGFWALVGAENYPAAREFAFPTDELKAEYAELLAKTDRYYNEVSSKVDDIMRQAQQSTGKVGVICGYGEVMPPVTSDGSRQSDSVILTVDESNGATCAPVGQSFGADYVQKVNDGHNHISPDRVIDASTAFFPDNTWFIKYGHHSFSGAKEIADRIFYTRGFDVFANAAYPQFMVRAADGGIVPLTAENGEAKTMTAGFTAKVLKVTFAITNTFLQVYKMFFRLVK